MTNSSLPDVAVWNLGSLYIQGMRMTWVSTTTFTVNQGQCRDSTNQNDIVLALPPENNGTAITTPFTATSTVVGVNGLDQGTIAASTLYYVYAIASSQNSTINLPPSIQNSQVYPPFATPSPTTPVAQDTYYVQSGVLFSLSSTAPLLPYGYDMFRRIGCVRTDGSSHFLPFWQSGYGNNRRMVYQTAIAPGSAATTGSTTYTTIGTLLNIVPQIGCDVLVDCSLIGNAAGDALYLAPYGNTSGGDVTRMSTVATTYAQLAQLICAGEFNAASTPVIEIDYKTTSGSDTVAFLIAGYVDQL